MSCVIKGLVDCKHSRVKQLVKLVINQQLLALRHLTQQRPLILRKKRILRMTWILSYVQTRLMQQSVSLFIIIQVGVQSVSLVKFGCGAFLLPGTGWVADFGEVNSKAPVAGVAFSAWDTPDSQPAVTEAGEKGWTKFTDFQPFCWYVYIMCK